MAAGGLTGAGGGSSTGVTTPPSPPRTDGTFSISQNSARQTHGDGKKPGGKPEQRKGDAGSGQTKSVEVQGQKARDFDAVQGRPPLGERQGQKESEKKNADDFSKATRNDPSLNVSGVKFDRSQVPGDRQQICAKIPGDSDPPCVLVKGSEALSDKDREAFASAYHDFIVNNDGADLAKHSADVVGYSKEDTAKVRIASQFIGASLPDGWRNTRIIAGSGSDLRMSSDTAGNTEWQRIADDDPPELYIVKINMDWGDHRTNPSGLARTIIHESLHRHDEGGWVTVVNEKHRALDSEARNRLQEYGLGAGGCLPVGEFLWGLLPPTYPGCSK